MNQGVPAASGERWHFCVLTPRGRGAIATIAIRGPGAIATLGSLFAPLSGRELAKYAIGSTVYGRFSSSDDAQEDVVVGIVAAEGAEIHCHGGLAAVAAICETLQSAGGIECSPQDWVRERATDKIATDALLALADAKTARAAAMLLDQYRGALSREIQSIDDLLAAGDAAAATAKINDLLARADVGLHLTRPWKVVFAGRPNVGKSSLMNAILGYERSIVWPQAGTTRDVLTATTAIDGWWVELSDVAGLRTSNDVVEAAGVARAEHEIVVADLVVFVSDLTASWDSELYRQVCRRTPAADIARPAIIVHNKCDLAEMVTDDRPSGIQTSTVTGIGVPDLSAAIAKFLVPTPPPPGAPIPFLNEHIDCLHKALNAVRVADLARARSFVMTAGH